MKSSKRAPVLIAVLRDYLREHVAELPDVDAVFIWHRRNPLRVLVVVAGPCQSGRDIFALWPKCMEAFAALDLDLQVVYRRNVPDLTCPPGAMSIERIASRAYV